MAGRTAPRVTLVKGSGERGALLPLAPQVANSTPARGADAAPSAFVNVNAGTSGSPGGTPSASPVASRAGRAHAAPPTALAVVARPALSADVAAPANASSGSMAAPSPAADSAPIDYAVRASELMANQMPRLAQRAERQVARVLFVAGRSEHGAGDDAIRAAAATIGRDGGDALAGLSVSAREAQRLGEAARAEYARRGGTPEALALQARAFGANPLDVEAAGNLAFLLLRQRPAQAEAARQLALHALTLRGARYPEGRIEDWATFAIASALAGRERDARNAFLVTLVAGAQPRTPVQGGARRLRDLRRAAARADRGDAAKRERVRASQRLGVLRVAAALGGERRALTPVCADASARSHRRDAAGRRRASRAGPCLAATPRKPGLPPARHGGKARGREGEAETGTVCGISLVAARFPPRREPDRRKRGMMKQNASAAGAGRDEGDMGEDGEDAKAAAARRSLALLNAQADAVRAELAGLRRDLAKAKDELSGLRTAQLLEANAELVQAAVHADSVAQTAVSTLDELARSTQHDELTGAPTRALMLDRLETAISMAQRRATRVGVIFLDLDYFKQINDSLGHAVGDRVLQLATRRLEASVRESDSVSRHGGDEFVVLLAEMAKASDAAAVAQKILESLAAPAHVGAHTLSLSGSLGISVYPEDGADANTLIECADAAMYRAKKAGPGRYAFCSEIVDGVEVDSRTPAEPTSPPGKRAESPLAEHEARLRELLEANKHLVSAAQSAQKLQASAEEAHHRQINFVAMAAHALRNPLSAIRMAATTLSIRRPTTSFAPRSTT